jgi:nucleotide-binding universal stress UspA family protein
MYESILVPTDGSDGAWAALDEAVELAARFDATVHSLSVVDTTAAYADTGGAELMNALEQAGTRTTAEAQERAEAADVEVVTTVEPGTPHRTILAYADDHDVDLVVMGTRGRTGLERYLLGSVTEKVVRTADIPVLTVRAPPEDEEN